MFRGAADHPVASGEDEQVADPVARQLELSSTFTDLQLDAVGLQETKRTAAGQEEAGAGQTIAADAESAGEEAPVAEPTTEVGSPPTVEDESATTGSSDSEEGIS